MMEKNIMVLLSGRPGAKIICMERGREEEGGGGGMCDTCGRD